MIHAARQHRLAVVTFLLLWLALSSPWLLGRFTIPYDAKALFQAQLQFLSNAIHSGQSPFWNPYTFSGVPQIADPQSLIFSPAFLLAYFFPDPPFGLLDYYVFTLLGLGGLAILYCCLDKGWHPGAAVVAALCFAFGGSAAWRVQHIGHIQSYCFMALALWLFNRAQERASPLWGAFAGLALGGMLIEPNQVAFLGALAFPVIFTVHILDGRIWPNLRAALPWGLWTAALCLAVALVPVAISWLFLAQSNRPVIDLAEAVRGSLHPASLLTFVVPDLFGAFDPAVDYWGPYSETWDKSELTLSQNMSQVYFGMLPGLIVLVPGLLRGHLWDRGVRPFTIVAGIAIVYALGGYTPIYEVLYQYVPGVGVFRRPVDATFLLGIAVSLVAGYLVHLWLSGQIRSSSSNRMTFEAAIVLGLLAAAAGVALHKGTFALAVKPLLVAMLWILLASLFLAVPAVWLKRGAVSLVILPGMFVAADLGVNNGPNGSTAVVGTDVADVLRVRTQNATVAFLKSQVRRSMASPWRDRIELAGLGFDWQNCGEVHSLEGTLGYNPFRIGLVSRAVGARDYIAGPDQRIFSPLFPSYRSQLADMLGLRFIASGVPIEKIDTRLAPDDLKLVRRTREAWIYENPRVLPRVLMVHDVRKADFEVILKTGAWPDFDARRTVLLEGGDSTVLNSAAIGSAKPGTGGSSHAEIAVYKHTAIEIHIRSDAPGVLLINDIWHPWWSATVDGKPVKLMRANAIFRAVAVPAGARVARLEFDALAGALHDMSGRLANLVR